MPRTKNITVFYIQSLRIILIAIVALFLPACNEGEPEPGPEPVPALPTPRPVDVENILPLAADLCNSASIDTVCRNIPAGAFYLQNENCTDMPAKEPLEGPIFIVIEAHDLNEWEHYPRNGRFTDIAYAASEVKNVICVKEEKIKTGTYMGGGQAYRLNWLVYLLDWSSGELLGNVDVYIGADPPEAISVDSDAGFGRPPDKAFDKWVSGTFPTSEWLEIKQSWTPTP